MLPLGLVVPQLQPPHRRQHFVYLQQQTQFPVALQPRHHLVFQGIRLPLQGLCFPAECSLQLKLPLQLDAGWSLCRAVLDSLVTENFNFWESR